MTHITQEIQNIQAQLPAGTRLVAVSKYHPESAIMEAYNAGQRIFGESHVQELCQKAQNLPSDIQWHFIGHLQTNKVKYIAPFISLIHAVDSEKLLAEIHRQGVRCGRQIPSLLQLHVAQESTKFGFTIEQALQFLQSGTWKQYTHAPIQGVMCMASHTNCSKQIDAEFQQAWDFFLEAQKNYFSDNPSFAERSWGMSDDFQFAVHHGSTLVRIGSKIFGLRQ